MLVLVVLLEVGDVLSFTAIVSLESSFSLFVFTLLSVVEVVHNGVCCRSDCSARGCCCSSCCCCCCDTKPEAESEEATVF